MLGSLKKGCESILKDGTLLYGVLSGLAYNCIMGGIVLGMFWYFQEIKIADIFAVIATAIVGQLIGINTKRLILTWTARKTNILIIAYGLNTLGLMIMGFANDSALVLLSIVLCSTVFHIDVFVRYNYFKERVKASVQRPVVTTMVFGTILANVLGMIIYIRLYTMFSDEGAFVTLAIASLLLFPILKKMEHKEAEEKGWLNFDGM